MNLHYQYFDCNGSPINEGDLIQLDDGSIKRVYRTDDANGDTDYGVIATNPDFLVRHPHADIEYYSLRSIGQRNMTRIDATRENHFIS